MRGHALIFAAILLVGLPVHAEPAQHIEAAFAAHVGEVADGVVTWRSSYWTHGPLDAAATIDLDFAVPVPGSATMRLAVPADVVKLQLRRDAARDIIGVSLTGSRYLPDLVTTMRTEATFDPPFAAGTPQRVELRGARYVPGDGAVISQGLLDTTHSVSAHEARIMDRAYGNAQGRAIYLRPDEAFVKSGGLSPFLVRDAELRGSAVWGLGGTFTFAMLLLAIGLRRAAKSARTEAAEAFLAEHDEGLLNEIGAA